MHPARLALLASASAALLTAASACQDDNQRLTSLEVATATRNGEVDTVAAKLDAETAGRKLADIDALGEAKTYAVTQANAAQAAAIAACKAYTDQAVKTSVPASEAHLFARGAGPMGKDLDLGRLRWDTFAAATVNGEQLDVDRGPYTALYFVEQTCNTQAYVPNPKSVLSSVRYVSSRKLLVTVDDTPEPAQAPPSINFVIDLSGKCVAGGFAGAVRWYKAMETGTLFAGDAGFKASTLLSRDVQP